MKTTLIIVIILGIVGSILMLTSSKKKGELRANDPVKTVQDALKVFKDYYTQTKLYNKNSTQPYVYFTTCKGICEPSASSNTVLDNISYLYGNDKTACMCKLDYDNIKYNGKGFECSPSAGKNRRIYMAKECPGDWKDIGEYGVLTKGLLDRDNRRFKQAEYRYHEDSADPRDINNLWAFIKPRLCEGDRRKTSYGLYNFAENGYVSAIPVNSQSGAKNWGFNFNQDGTEFTKGLSGPWKWTKIGLSEAVNFGGYDNTWNASPSYYISPTKEFKYALATQTDNKANAEKYFGCCQPNTDIGDPSKIMQNSVWINPDLKPDKF